MSHHSINLCFITQ